MDDKSLKLTRAEIVATFSDPIWAERFPPILNVEQLADMVQVPIGTIRDWRSRGLLRGCGRKVGRYLRFYRDRVIDTIFNQGLLDEK